MPSKTAKSVDSTDSATEKQLDDAGRAEGTQKEQTKETMEPQLAKDRSKEEASQTMEGQLEEGRKKSRSAAVNTDQSGIVEKRLNDAKKTVYPHRNEEAYKRTGNKRPVNALEEEMGDASDAAKDKRYQEKWRTPKGTKGGDVVQAFNLNKKRYASYISYKSGEGDFATAKKIDEKLTSIMAKAQKEAREYSEAEKKEIEALKSQKAAALGYNGKA